MFTNVCRRGSRVATRATKLSRIVTLLVIGDKSTFDPGCVEVLYVQLIGRSVGTSVIIVLFAKLTWIGFWVYVIVLCCLFTAFTKCFSEVLIQQIVDNYSYWYWIPLDN